MSDVTKALAFGGADSLNMGWSAVGLWRIGMVFVGLFTILFTLVLLLSFDNYRDNTDDKTTPLIIASVGLGLFIIGVALTDRRFSYVVAKMKENTAVFAPESFSTAGKAVQANIEALSQLKDDLLVLNAITKPEEGTTFLENISKIFD